MDNVLEERLATAGDDYYQYHNSLEEAAEMLHDRHERALDERNQAMATNLLLNQTAVELGRIAGMVEKFAPWTAGCDTVSGRVHAALLRLERLERSVKHETV